MALRLAWALMETVNSKLEPGVHGFSILAHFGVFFSPDAVYNQHVRITNTRVLQVLPGYSWAW